MLILFYWRCSIDKWWIRVYWFGGERLSEWMKSQNMGVVAYPREQPCNDSSSQAVCLYRLIWLRFLWLCSSIYYHQSVSAAIHGVSGHLMALLISTKNIKAGSFIMSEERTSRQFDFINLAIYWPIKGNIRLSRDWYRRVLCREMGRDCRKSECLSFLHM